ncbi:YmiA family putative membrane protein [Pantoea sp. 1.19]|uniref:YmiA family putative membrane protein n=1 Tax=Pantoea sp. 1.19 TaxID=1925589 RepID=UPI000948B08A|nr:YmiA family putative membrane protein [Pantoea sp. 1.19]
MATRLSVNSDFQEKSTSVKRKSDLKRKAWLAVFAASALFWVLVALVIWRFWG